MNRRRFFQRVIQGVVLTATTVYAPGLLTPIEPVGKISVADMLRSRIADMRELAENPETRNDFADAFTKPVRTRYVDYDAVAREIMASSAGR